MLLFIISIQLSVEHLIAQAVYNSQHALAIASVLLFNWSVSNGKKGPTVRKECQLVRLCELALLSSISFCNIPVIICKLDLVFCL